MTNLEIPEARSTSPWLEGTPLTGAPLAGDHETEVAVVGAGAAGLAAALELARAGRRVTVLERRSVGAGLTGRCAGALLASSGRWHARDVRELGEHRAWARRVLAAVGRRRALELVEAHDLPCGLDRRGSALLALSPREWADAVHSAEQLGEHCELWDRARAHHRAVAGLFAGGLYDPHDAALDPAALARGMARLAAAAGARICEGTEVSAVEEPTEGGVLVRTARGDVRAGMAVLAVNAWTPWLVPALADRLLPYRAQWLLTEPLAGPVPDGVWLTNHGHEHWRHLADGAVLFGGCREASLRTEDGASEEATNKVQGLMERFLSKAFPALADPSVRYRWAAAAATTCDGLPIIGPPAGQTATVLACGFSEHELALSIGAGMAAADLVQSGHFENSEIFSARRFQ